MNRKRLATLIAGRVGMSIEQADDALVAMIEIIKSEIVKGTTVSLVGFGKFYAKVRKERTSIHPRIAGKMCHVSAHATPRFQASKTFKYYVSICFKPRN